MVMIGPVVVPVAVVVTGVIVTVMVAGLGLHVGYYTPIGYLTSDSFAWSVRERTVYRRYAFAASINSWAAFDCSLVG